jgi:hypothetical protein
VYGDFPETLGARGGRSLGNGGTRLADTEDHMLAGTHDADDAHDAPLGERQTRAARRDGRRDRAADAAPDDASDDASDVADSRVTDAGDPMDEAELDAVTRLLGFLRSSDDD